MRLRSVLAWSAVSLSGVAVACGGDDDTGSPSKTGHAGTSATGGSAGTARGGDGGTAGSVGASGAGSANSTGGSANSTGGSANATGGSANSTGGSSQTAGRGGVNGVGGSATIGGEGGEAGQNSAGASGDAGLAGASGRGASGDGAGGDGSGPTGGVKLPLDGLIDMQIISWHNTDAGVPSFVIADLTPFPGQFGGIVLNVAWNQLQPTNATTLDTTFIDHALADVRTYNANNQAAPIGVKLRVYAGDTAPDWAKQIDDGPVTLYRNQAGCPTYPTTPCPITVGKYWTSDYIAAWRALQTALAARYDAEPLIRQVAVTSCAPQTDEPFVPSTDATAKSNLLYADYTDDVEKACLGSAIDDYSAWTQTLIDYTFNPFVKIGGGTDTAFTLSVMDDCRTRLGTRCVLDNHALAWPLADADPLTPIYDEMQSLGGPVNFQTQSPTAMACQWTGTLALGVSFGARAVEIWPKASLDGFDSLTTDQVGTLASELSTPIAVPTGDPTGACPDFN